MRSTNDYIDQINNGLCYKPGCRVRAADWSQRHADSILVQVRECTYDFSRQHAPKFDTTVEVTWHFVIVPKHHRCETEFWLNFWNNLQKLQSHENRECFRLWNGEEWVGIFNPHEPEGQMNFGQPELDLAFGDLAINSDDVAHLFEVASA